MIERPIDTQMMAAIILAAGGSVTVRPEHLRQVRGDLVILRVDSGVTDTVRFDIVHADDVSEVAAVEVPTAVRTSAPTKDWWDDTREQVDEVLGPLRPRLTDGAD